MAVALTRSILDLLIKALEAVVYTPYLVTFLTYC